MTRQTFNPAVEKAARAEFEKLTRDEVAAAIARMSRDGFSDYCIAAATKLSVEAVRQFLAERRESP